MDRPPSSDNPARNSNCQASPNNNSDRSLAISVTAQSTYNDGQLYRPAQGRKAPQNGVVDHVQNTHSVVSGRPAAADFLRAIERELKIRFFTQNTVKSYICSVKRFFNWFGRMPHSVTREDVREYLEVLVDGGASSEVGTSLSAIRTAFDKMCCRQVTLGLATPRKPSRLPVVLNQKDIRLMLEDCGGAFCWAGGV